MNQSAPNSNSVRNMNRRDVEKYRLNCIAVQALQRLLVPATKSLPCIRTTLIQAVIRTRDQTMFYFHDTTFVHAVI